MLRAAIVGCGKAAENHVREIQKLSSARVVAVCDLEPLMAEQLAVRYGIASSYSNFDAMLDTERFDVIHITTPPDSHLDLGISAVDAGSHIFVEKPLALNHADSRRLIDYAISRKRKLTIAYGYYFDPVCRAMRDMVADGVLGEPVHVESFLGYTLSGQFGKAILADRGHWVHQLPGKLVHNVIDHLLNKVTEFVRSDRPLIAARAWQREERLYPRFTLPDELRLMVLGEDVSAFATFTSHARPVAHFLNVYGTRNTLHLDFEAGIVPRSSTSLFPGALGRLSHAFGQAFQYLGQGGRNAVRFARSQYQPLAGLNFLIAAFYDSILLDAPLPIPYEDILRVTAMTDDVLQIIRPDRCDGR